jgi:hypothetical protein
MLPSTPPVRNPNFWAADVDLTCWSAYTVGYGTGYAATLITPWHVLLAQHYHAGVGTTIQFVTADGTVVNATIASTPIWLDPNYDIMVAKLDQSLEGTGISYASILPANWTNYTDLTGISILACRNIGKQGMVARTTILNTASQLLEAVQSTDSTEATWYQTMDTGDSSSPSFLLVNGVPVLLCIDWYRGPQGNFTTAFISQINAAIVTLDGSADYTLSEVDLSGFDLYTPPPEVTMFYWQGSVSNDWATKGNWSTTEYPIFTALTGNLPGNGDSCTLYQPSPTHNPTINSGTTISLGTGVCDIPNITLASGGSILVGTFSGSEFTNNSVLWPTSVTFSGSEFTNNGTIGYAGSNSIQLSGSGFTNNGTINAGTFSGPNFINATGQSVINGGIFSGSGFANSGSVPINAGTINGGVFTGSGFTNGYGFIYGGLFTGSGFNAGSNHIYGGTWIVTGTFTINGSSVTGSGDANPGFPLVALDTATYSVTATTQAADAATLTGTTLNVDGTDTTVAFGASNGTAKSGAVFTAGEAAQLATDEAAVTTAKNGVLTTTTILGVTGTYVGPTVSEVAAGVAYGPNSSYAGTAVLTEGAVTDAIAGLGSNLTTLLTNLGIPASGHTVAGDMADIKTQADLIGTNAADSPNAVTAQTSIGTMLAALGSLTSAERNAVADALLDRANAVDGKTVRQTLRCLAAVLAGDGCGIKKFVGLDSAINRIQVTVDACSNRSAVAHDR